MKEDEVAPGDRVQFSKWANGHSQTMNGVILCVVRRSYGEVEVWADDQTAAPGISSVAVSALRAATYGLQLDGPDFREAGRLLGSWCASVVESGASLTPDVASWWKKAERAFTSEKLVRAVKDLADDQVKMTNIAALGGEPGIVLQEHAADLESTIASLRAKMCVLYAEEIAAAEAAALKAEEEAKAAAAKMADAAKMF